MKTFIAILVLFDLLMSGYQYFFAKDVPTAIFFLCGAIFLEILNVEETIKEKNKGE